MHASDYCIHPQLTFLRTCVAVWVGADSCRGELINIIKNPAALTPQSAQSSLSIALRKGVGLFYIRSGGATCRVHRKSKYVKSRKRSPLDSNLNIPHHRSAISALAAPTSRSTHFPHLPRRTSPASTPQSCERTRSGRGRTPGRGRGLGGGRRISYASSRSFDAMC